MVNRIRIAPSGRVGGVREGADEEWERIRKWEMDGVDGVRG
jgi:hypothetical protein